MNKYYFTFGSGHHTIYGQSLSKIYTVIEADDEIEARKVMFSHNGRKWSGCYTEEAFKGQPEQYGLYQRDIWEIEACCGLSQLELEEVLKSKTENEE